MIDTGSHSRWGSCGRCYNYHDKGKTLLVDITLFMHAPRYFSPEILYKAPRTRFPHCGTKKRGGEDDADISKRAGQATAAMTIVIGKNLDSDVDRG